jgi:hypothetical protein
VRTSVGAGRREPASRASATKRGLLRVATTQSTESLEFDDEIREAARSLVAEAEQWLDAMPVGRRRLISSPNSDTW